MDAAEKKLLVLALGVVFALIHITGLAAAMGDNFRQGKNDFAAFYMGARLSGTGQLYDAGRHYEGQKALLGYSMPAVTFIRLPFYAVLLKPLGWLDYQSAWTVFLTLNALCALWFCRTFLWGDHLAFLLGAGFLPAYAALANGQDVWFVAALFALAVLLARRGEDFAAGAVLSLCAIKPHLFVLAPLALLLQRKWRWLAGAAAGGAVLLAVSFLAEGGAWAGEFLATVSHPRVHPRLEVMPTIRNLAAIAGWPSWAVWLLSALVAAAAAWVAARTRDVETALAAALAGGLVVNYHAYMADTVMLLPAFALLRRHGLRGGPLWLWALLLTPLPSFLLVYGPPHAAAFPAAILAALAGLLFWRPAAAGAGGAPAAPEGR